MNMLSLALMILFVVRGQSVSVESDLKVFGDESVDVIVSDIELARCQLECLSTSNANRVSSLKSMPK